MGHIRLGRLPKTKNWIGLFRALERENVQVHAIAKEASIAAQERLATLENDPAVNYCFWVLVEVANAARTDMFQSQLEKSLGIFLDEQSTGAKFVSEIATATSRAVRDRALASPFTHFAEMSMREVLSRYILESSPSLFGSSLRDVQFACKRISTKKNFGEAAKAFYASLMAKSILYVTDKEASNYIGVGKAIAGSAEAVQFQNDLKRYCFESSKIIEDFAAGWFSKQNWKSKRKITEQSTQRFTSYALQKLQMELKEGLK